MNDAVTLDTKYQIFCTRFIELRSKLKSTLANNYSTGFRAADMIKHFGVHENTIYKDGLNKKKFPKMYFADKLLEFWDEKVGL